MDLRYLHLLVIIGSTCQYGPKQFLFLVRKAPGVVVADMSLGILQGTAAFVADVSLMTILQDWARVSIQARHCFSICITMTDWYKEFICSVLFRA